MEGVLGASWSVIAGNFLAFKKFTLESAVLALGRGAIAGILIYGNVIAVGADEFKVVQNQLAEAVVIRSRYDYVPALMNDSRSIKMWWCGGFPAVDGDQILYLDNIVSGEQVFYESADDRIKRVFGPAEDKGKFDSAHTCDPSIIHVDGHYYMYYGGIDALRKRQLKLLNPTAIGVAISDDGIRWVRANDGAAIFTIVDTTEGKPNAYGVGQPAVVYVQPYYYMLFTDTTALVANSNKGANLVVVRSESPLFSSYEELTQVGFRPVLDGKVTRNFRLLEGFSAEMAFVDGWNLFMVAVNRKPKETWLYFFDKNFQPVGNKVSVANEWSEGPGIVRDRLGHLQPSTEARVTFQMIRSVGDRSNPATWDLYSEMVELERSTEKASAVVPSIPPASN